MTICSGVHPAGGVQPNGYTGARCVGSSAWRMTSMTSPSNCKPRQPQQQQHQALRQRPQAIPAELPRQRQQPPHEFAGRNTGARSACLDGESDIISLTTCRLSPRQSRGNQNALRSRANLGPTPGARTFLSAASPELQHPPPISPAIITTRRTTHPSAPLSFGFRISAFLRISAFGLRISCPLPFGFRIWETGLRR